MLSNRAGVRSRKGACWSLASAAALTAITLTTATARAVEFPGPEPGQSTVRIDGDRIVLENRILSATWKRGDGQFALAALADRIQPGSASAEAPEAFVLTLADGRSIKASELRSAGEPEVIDVEPQPEATRHCQRFAGHRVRLPLATADGKLAVTWEVLLRDGSNAVRQRVSVRAKKEAVPLQEIAVPIEADGIRQCGEVDGSVLVADNFFFACEHPMADNRVQSGRGIASMRRFGPLGPGESWSVPFGFGVVPQGQLRRGFLYYVERQRPRPYRPFVHYNSWYDIVLDKSHQMDQAPCLAAIECFGENLTKERGVKLDSFVFDGGWSDHKNLWGFNEGFPRGFAPLAEAAAKYDSALGVWLSPWGGYGEAKRQRLLYGKKQGFEMNENGFSLAGPKYCARFRSVCSEMITKYGVNYFKFDGVGAGNNLAHTAATPQAPDIEALLRLIADLRRLEPDLFVSVTTGTWPSPYWLWHGDSIWRQGRDYGFYGEGPKRLQWLTYRDMILHKMIVRRGPLYPINSLMIVGVAYGKHILPADMSDDLKELSDEFRMLFASGTQNLELYISPEMMTPAMWDRLAEAARWGRANAAVLEDVHWIGGDPGEAEPYGYASWTPQKGILALRNPASRPATLAVDVQTAFELPAGAPRRYRLESPWKAPAGGSLPALVAGQSHEFRLAPYEVLVLEALPEP